ncbi:Pkinase-domain-containing protein [Coniophora puteana RWD-64-598 SS2]|uniref:Pkinase-domain-containing protein n=1 Tax=Coniophora puteana (strain RWD-64-598) TaxID=741705 RepID=A0A5M3N2Q3_CONPW|nr:Pkinase-domain-containing protein [Coniophora puteana RWD-64-598 SS2]EIW85155.1 Pkinase-domain-containing protein [Coniophora puteana RWD-64-598 SS2]
MAAATISSLNPQSLDSLASKSSSPTSSTTETTPADQTLSSSRSFINLSSPPRSHYPFPTASMSSTGSTILDPPHGQPFADYLRTWSDSHVARWLTEIKCSAHTNKFRDNDIRGDVLLEIDQDTLKEMGIHSVGDRLRIVNGVKALRQRCSSRSTLADPFRARLLSDSGRDVPGVNGVDGSHSRSSSRDDSRDSSPNSRVNARRLESVRPAPLVLSSNTARNDLPRLIREPGSGDSRESSRTTPPPIRPLPQPAPSSFSNFSSGSTSRPQLPPLPPAPRGQPPQPPTGRANTRFHPLSGPRARTPNQADATPFANSPLPPAPSQGILTPQSSTPQTGGWAAYGLPSDPRAGMKQPQVRSPSPLGSGAPARSNAAHNRNISFGGVSSPLSSTPTGKLPPRPSTTGNNSHPYASAQPSPQLQPQPSTSQTLHPGSNQNQPILSPIAESFASTNSSSPGSSSPPTGFSVRRGPFNPASHINNPSDARHKLIKFVLPDEGRSAVVDVADCFGGVEVMEKVLRKFDKLSSRKNDSNIMSRVETDEGGLSVDGWSVCLEYEDNHDIQALSEAELLAICHSPIDEIMKDHGLYLRKTGRGKRSKALARIFGEEVPAPIPRNVSPTSPAVPSRPSPSADDDDTPLSAFNLPDSMGRSKAIKRASTISILSGLGVRDPEKALESPPSPSIPASATLTTPVAAKKPSKLRNFFGQRPPSELITNHLTEYFPLAEKKALRTARHSMMLRSSSVHGKRDSTISMNPPLPSRFSISTQGSGSQRRSSSPTRTNRNSMASSTSIFPDRSIRDSQEHVLDEPPRLSVSNEDGRSVILTGDDVDKLSTTDKQPQLPPVAFPTESLSESMEDLTAPDPSKAVSRTSSNASRRTSHLSELRSKRDKSDTASLLTVDEITAEVENRRQSMAVDMGVEGAEDWTKVEPDIDEMSEYMEAELEEEDEEEEEEEEEGEEEEEEVGQTMTSETGTKWIKGALIGAGSFGKVYLGMDAENGLLMAVKQVELPKGTAPNEARKKSMLDALEREIDLLKELQHPNIVQYLYSSNDDDYLNIFLEYVPGGSVAALLRSYGAFEEPLVKNFVRQILQGLNYLHERDIVHRDIKGANILVDNKGGVKISDFGISKKVVEGNLLTTKRNRTSLQGSVFWMAPEVVKQTAHTNKADIWSVGCLVVEMLTGEHPWSQLTQMQAIFKIGQSIKPTIPSDISADAQDFLAKAFDLDHTARPSATEFLQHPWLAAKKSKAPARV